MNARLLFFTVTVIGAFLSSFAVAQEQLQAKDIAQLLVQNDTEADSDNERARTLMRALEENETAIKKKFDEFIEGAKDELSKSPRTRENESKVVKSFNDLFAYVQQQIRTLASQFATESGQNDDLRAAFARKSANWIVNTKSLIRDVLAIENRFPKYDPDAIGKLGNALKPDTAYVDFVRFYQEYPESESYGRWIVTRGAAPDSTVVTFDEVGLDDKGSGTSMVVKKLRGRLNALITEAENRQDEVTVGAVKLRWTTNDYTTNLRKLNLLLAEFRKVLIDEARLQSYRRWVLSPAADIWLVPFSALPESITPAGDVASYAVERRRVTYALSGRDLLPKTLPQRRHGNVLLAAPNFNARSADYVRPSRLAAVTIDDVTQQALANSYVPHFEFSSDELLLPSLWCLGHNSLIACPLFRGRWYCPPAPPQPPPGTFGGASTLGGTEFPPQLRLLQGKAKDFAEQVRPHLGINRQSHGWLLDGDATEPAFELALKSGESTERNSIVICTHGIFLPAKSGDDPLLHCGLGATGFNVHAARAATRPPSPRYDGYLSGREIAAMKEIEGTDVVFLVACETGVGHIDGHQLASVRHAFTLAGAKTVIGTSWKVPANEATKLALQFYGYNWAPGKANDPDAALHYSQLELIQNLRMGHRVGQARVERQAHPYFWASFSTTGIHND